MDWWKKRPISFLHSGGLFGVLLFALFARGRSSFQLNDDVWPPTFGYHCHGHLLQRNPPVCTGDRRDHYPHSGRYPGKAPQEIPPGTAGEKDLTNRETITLSFFISGPLMPGSHFMVLLPEKVRWACLGTRGN